MARLLMENAEWAFFEPFITGIRGRGGRPASNHRQVLDGIFWIARIGSQWRDMPEDFGNWSSVYRQFRRWTVAGLWDLILDALNESEAMPDQVQMIRWPADVRLRTARGDSTIIRAHHPSPGNGLLANHEREAARAKRGLKDKVWPFAPPLGDVNMARRAESGFTTKIHLIANTHGLTMKAGINGGEVSDDKGFDLLRVDPLPAPKVFIADKGYGSNHMRDFTAAEGGKPVIPTRANRKVPKPVAPITYAPRNHVERCFNKMKCSRRLATRYDRTAASYIGFVQIDAARIWARSLST